MRKFEGIKKVDLHCHLEGSIDLDLASKWLRINKDEARELFIRNATNRNRTEYLNKYKLPISLLQLKTRLKDAAYALAESMKSENVIYAEIRISPLDHMEKGLTLEEIIECTLLGLHLSDLKSQLILVMKREASVKENQKVINLAKKYLKKGVCAVDLAGDESLFPTSTFKCLFEYAKEKEVPFVIHAGESGSYTDINSAISLGAKRIGHGVQAIKDFKTMENLKKKNIPLEICLTSNLDAGMYERITSHPISRLIDSGLSITINTDNRTISKTDLSHEYYLLNKYFGFTKEDFKRFNIIAIENAFLSDKEKAELIKKLD